MSTNKSSATAVTISLTQAVALVKGIATTQSSIDRLTRSVLNDWYEIGYSIHEKRFTLAELDKATKRSNKSSVSKAMKVVRTADASPKYMKQLRAETFPSLEKAYLEALVVGGKVAQKPKADKTAKSVKPTTAQLHNALFASPVFKALPIAEQKKIKALLK